MGTATLRIERATDGYRCIVDGPNGLREFPARETLARARQDVPGYLVGLPIRYVDVTLPDVILALWAGSPGRGYSLYRGDRDPFEVLGPRGTTRARLRWDGQARLHVVGGAPEHQARLREVDAWLSHFTADRQPSADRQTWVDVVVED